MSTDTPTPEVIKTKTTKIYKPNEARVHAPDEEDSHIPDGICRDQMGLLVGQMLEKFGEEQLYDTKHFLKHFGDRRAIFPLPFDSLLDLVKKSVCYDEQDQIDVRLLLTLLNKNSPDYKLLVDVCLNVSERFVNNRDRPKSPLSLMQFKTVLAYRLQQVGF